MNNANCYAFDAKAKYIYDSDSEQQYQFLGNNIVRTDKSMSLISQKPRKAPRNQQMKKSNSFLLSNKTLAPPQKVAVQSKDKSKTSTKKCLNVTEVRKKQTINSKNSMTKTSVSIGNTSTKSIKSTKNRSISRDYLIIDEQIYHCDNIEEVNQQLICGGSSVYSHQRFIKATLKNQQKLQKYILSFSQFCSFRKKSKPCINELSQSQKKKLYLLLKSQTTDNTVHSQKSSKHHKQLSFENLIKQAYNKIQQKSQEIIKQKPEQENHVRRWKNIKLHQLMEIHTCLNQDSVSQSQDIIQHHSYKAEDLKLDFNQNLSKNLDKKNQCKVSYPNLKLLQLQKKQVTKSDNFSIRSHEVQDKFPQQKNHDLKVLQRQNYLPPNHILSKDGIVSFLHNLWDYLIDSDKICHLIQNLQLPFGLSSQQKLKFFGNEIKSLPYYQNGQTLILPNQAFVSFCKQNPSLSDVEADEQKPIIIFQKAIFDALNEQLSKFETDFPFGSYHPFQDNNNTAVYLIDENNAMVVWEQCMQKIEQSNKLSLGKITESQQRQAVLCDKSFKTLISQQATFYQWEKTRPLARRSILEQLIKQIQGQIMFQFCKELQFL